MKSQGSCHRFTNISQKTFIFDTLSFFNRKVIKIDHDHLRRSFFDLIVVDKIVRDQMSGHRHFLLFQIGTEPSDNQYLVVDIGLGAVPIMMIGNCGPYDILVKQKPTRHLLSFLPLFSVISFLFIQTLFYVGVWFYVQQQEWFVPYEFEAGLWPPKASFEQTNIFLMSCCACLVASVVFSKAAPYRKHLFTNGTDRISISASGWIFCYV